MPDKAAAPAMMRSPLGQVRGLGSAHAGVGHWWAQKVTAIALIPLTLWFVCAVIRLAGQPRAAVEQWAASPLVASLLIALILATFHHLQLGLQAIYDDYIRGDHARMATTLITKGVVALLALVSIVSVLKLALGM